MTSAPVSNLKAIRLPSLGTGYRQSSKAISICCPITVYCRSLRAINGDPEINMTLRWKKGDNRLSYRHVAPTQ